MTMHTSLRPLLLPCLLLPAVAAAEVPSVAVDIPPVHSLVERVMGDLGTPQLVIQPGASPHGYAMRPSEAGPVLIIQAREKSWGPNYLSFGMNYEDNFDGDTRFNLASGLRMTELNRLGAEWQTGLQLGTQPWVRSQWSQPLDYGYDRFAVVGVEYRRDDYSIWFPIFEKFSY